MKKILFSTFFIILSLILVVVLRDIMPKYGWILRFLFFYLLFYGYLWFSVNARIKKFSPAVQASATIFYWLPFALVIGLMVYGFFVPFLDWNTPMRTYFQNFILIFFLAVFFPILTLALADIVRLIKFIVLLFIPEKKSSIPSIPRFRPLLMTGWIIGALIFLIMTAGTIFWQFDFKVKQQVIVLKDLPQAFDGLRIVQISDIHLGSWGSKQKLKEAMDEINKLHPDLIFFTGDMFNYCTADGKGFEDILGKLRATQGVYAILGNHDYGDYVHWPSALAKKQNIEDLKSFYKYQRWKLLLNSNEILKKGTDSIAVIGVENWGATRRFQRHGDIAKAQKGTGSMAVQLLLSHDPAYWDSIVRKKFKNIDVTFSGHTHGGQIGIDCCNIHWSPAVWISRQWSGLYKNPDSDSPQYLYVNQGLGNIGYSGRIGILPEITLIILKKN